MHELAAIYYQSHKSSANVALRSPPDVFAVCAYFAKVSGCYRAFAQTPHALRSSMAGAESDGLTWRKLLDRSAAPPTTKVPSEVRKAWALIGARINRPIASLAKDDAFCQAALYLLATADSACAGIGVPTGTSGSHFELNAEGAIRGKGTLCRSIPSSSLRVLPKQHTPLSGFNLRSLTHHLAFCSASEVEPVWTMMPRRRLNNGNFNILLAPWPLTVHASEIRPSKRPSTHRRFGYFDFSPRLSGGTSSLKAWLTSLFAKAGQVGQQIDLLVLPELAVSEHEWRDVVAVSAKYRANVICGVRVNPGDDGLGANVLKVKAPYSWHDEIVQFKHHRWQIESGQISTYGLGGTLDRSKAWWENIRIPERKLNFLAFNENLVVCPLICEDLARQDPVAELVRSVGPNLVVALLMDGPQLSDRWSARYAAVLADDPGSSVLTITGLGMVKLSRPGMVKPSRVFGSWKDALGKFTPLELGEVEDAMILNIQFHKQEEISVDGRSDGDVASVPVLCGIHPLSSGGRR